MASALKAPQPGTRRTALSASQGLPEEAKPTRLRASVMQLVGLDACAEAGLTELRMGTLVVGHRHQSDDSHEAGERERLCSAAFRGTKAGGHDAASDVNSGRPRHDKRQA